MTTILSILFILGYVAIAFEHPLKVNKAAVAILTAVLCWTTYALFSSNHEEVLHHLAEHLSDVSQIIFFLIGAMTIVDLIDSHKGFKTITDVIKTNDKRKLLWIICMITFFLSSLLDNLTTAIVMVSLLRKILSDKNDRLIFSSMVIIASNAGGAWSPIGDVTTTMLWIGGQITTVAIMKSLFIPSMISLIVPLAYQSLYVKGTIDTSHIDGVDNESEPGARIVFFLGLGFLIFVPIFKTFTHLPPYMGILLGLSIMWIVTDLLHYNYEERHHLRVHHALGRIDIGSTLFFLGILMAIASLESLGILKELALWMDNTIGNKDAIITIMGLASSIIDNVPLVAASMGMYDLATYPVDSKLWEMIAYCAGTGGSILIIGSAAGVVVMGMEKIEFIWYLKKVSFTALLGYFSGVISYLIISSLLGIH
jgi:NhaD family Na+/H+ antiporter